jgi:hypothetical protein
MDLLTRGRVAQVPGCARLLSAKAGGPGVTVAARRLHSCSPDSANYGWSGELGGPHHLHKMVVCLTAVGAATAGAEGVAEWSMAAVCPVRKCGVPPPPNKSVSNLWAC